MSLLVHIWTTSRLAACFRSFPGSPFWPLPPEHLGFSPGVSQPWVFNSDFILETGSDKEPRLVKKGGFPLLLSKNSHRRFPTDSTFMSPTRRSNGSLSLRIDNVQAGTWYIRSGRPQERHSELLETSPAAKSSCKDLNFAQQLRQKFKSSRLAQRTKFSTHKYSYQEWESQENIHK